MALGTWILALVTPLLGRIFVALGLSVVSITGLSAVLSSIKAEFLTYANQIPAAGLDLALLAGAGQGFGIIFGACATRLIIIMANSTMRVLGTATA